MINRISVYVVAHQDDWQLFMYPDISADILDQHCRTIIIYTTAGDAGRDKIYWRAREMGAIRSLIFHLSGEPKIDVEKKSVAINQKWVQRVTIGNCCFCFLRLPDGGMSGEGFELTRFESLSKIRSGTINRILTVDGKNEFFSSLEISDLLNQILENELNTLNIDVDRMTLNFPEFDAVINPHDHSDHLQTALVLSDMPIYDSLKKYAFVHYDIKTSASDLTGLELFWKVGLFCVYHQTVLDQHGYSTIHESPLYNVWCSKRTICREIV